MSNYTFSAFSNEGKSVSGIRRAESEEKLRADLSKGGLQATVVAQTQTKFSSKLYELVSPKELSIFCKQMSVLFYSQVTLLEGVGLLSDQTDNHQLKTALREVGQRMEEGMTFADAFSMYENVFPKYLLNMVKIGEQSGTLDTVFSQMGDYYGKESNIRKKLKSAIINPLILMALMFAVILLLILKVVPMFNGILQSLGGEIPAATKAILAFSTFASRYILIIVLVIGLLIAFFLYYKKTPAGRLWFDKMAVKLPYLRFITTRTIITRYSRSLSIFLKAGIQLLNGVTDANVIVDNSYLAEGFDKAADAVKEGQNLSEALEGTEVFPPLYLKMIAIGNKAGHLDEMLSKAADIYEEELDESIERATQLIEPIMTIILAVVVGVILISVMLPMIDIMNSIG